MSDADIFAVIPATQRWTWLWWGLFAVFLLVLGVIIAGVYSVLAANHATVSLDGQQLHVRGGFYSRKLPLKEVQKEHAAVVNLQEQRQYAPVSRRNGIGLPGLQAGWFRLRNNEKALIFVTDPSQVVYLPTRNGYSLLFSLQHPQAFIDKLTELG